MTEFRMNGPRTSFMTPIDVARVFVGQNPITVTRIDRMAFQWLSLKYPRHAP